MLVPLPKVRKYEENKNLYITKDAIDQKNIVAGIIENVCG